MMNWLEKFRAPRKDPHEFSDAELAAAQRKARDRRDFGDVLKRYPTASMVLCWVPAAIVFAVMAAPWVLGLALLAVGPLAALGPAFAGRHIVRKADAKQVALHAIAQERTPEGRIAQLEKTKEAFEQATASGMELEKNVSVKPALTLKRPPGMKRRFQ